ncbi:MAG: response regulator [Chloroflexota bacterium]
MREKPLVLIIDDDIDYVRISKRVLERGGYEVVTASLGSEGLNLAQETKPDAILLDFMMETNTAGASVAQALGDNPELRGIPVLLITAARTVKPWWRDRLNPNEDWLPVVKVLDKPVSPEDLLNEVGQIVKRIDGSV